MLPMSLTPDYVPPCLCPFPLGVINVTCVDATLHLHDATPTSACVATPSRHCTSGIVSKQGSGAQGVRQHLVHISITSAGHIWTVDCACNRA
jgi:hypothetical protein